MLKQPGDANIFAAIARWCRCTMAAFRIVQKEVVLADIRQQVEAGAQHITFGDPDFLNGPGHVLPIVKALHQEFPGLSYDVTIKVEHLLKYRHHLPLLREQGHCCEVATVAISSSQQ